MTPFFTVFFLPKSFEGRFRSAAALLWLFVQSNVEIIKAAAAKILTPQPFKRGWKVDGTLDVLLGRERGQAQIREPAKLSQTPLS